MATYWENSCSFGLRYVSWYKYLIVSLVFSHLGFWSRNLFLIAPFPDLCLLVPFFQGWRSRCWLNTRSTRRVAQHKAHQGSTGVFLLLADEVLTSTHNLCFGAKIRKIGIPLQTPVFLYKSGVQGCKHCTVMFS